MAKKKKTAEQRTDKPSFEEALEELRTIVAALEEGTATLDASLQQFERGTQLIQLCHSTLETAELRIEQLVGTGDDGEPETVPFDASATFDGKTQRAGKRPAKQTQPEDDDENYDVDDDGDGPKSLF